MSGTELLNTVWRYRWLAFLPLLLVGTTCSSPDPLESKWLKSDPNKPQTPQLTLGTEPTWDEQIGQVRAGTRSEIESDQAIEDSEFLQVVSVSGIEKIQLPKAHITDSALGELPPNADLNWLMLGESPIGDRGAQHLSRFPKLRFVNLPASRIGDAGLLALSGIPHLELLRLGTDQVTSAGLLAICDCDHLRFLHLIGVNIDEGPLLKLAQIKSLESFYLDGIELPDSTIEKIFEVNPKLHVHIDTLHHNSDPRRGHE